MRANIWKWELIIKEKSLEILADKKEFFREKSGFLEKK